MLATLVLRSVFRSHRSSYLGRRNLILSAREKGKQRNWPMLRPAKVTMSAAKRTGRGTLSPSSLLVHVVVASKEQPRGAAEFEKPLIFI
jgi:hypothetical protein